MIRPYELIIDNPERRAGQVMIPNPQAVATRHIPPTWKRLPVSCYLADGRLILIGDPPPDRGPDDELGHDCDANGCGSAHVLAVFRPTLQQLADLGHR